MNVNQKIEKALTDYVSGNIWPLACPLEAEPDEFIIYLPEYEGPEEFGDNEDLAWGQYMQVHWFKKEASKKPVNYIRPRKQIRSLLKQAGFSVSQIDTDFEKDTGYTHLVFSCYIGEDLEE